MTKTTPAPAHQLYSASEIAKWTGLTRQAVAKAGREGPLRPAKVGRKYNVTHPAASKWLEDRGVDVDDLNAVTGEPVSPTAIESELGSTSTDPLDAIDAMTLKELTDRYGTKEEFLSWTRSRKELAAAKRQELLLARLKGLVIGREEIQRVTDHLEKLNLELLESVASSLARRLTGASLSPEEALTAIRDRIGTALRVAGESTARSIRALDPEDPLRAPRGRVPRPLPMNQARRALAAAKAALREHAAPRIAEHSRKRAEHGGLEVADVTAFAAGVMEATLVQVQRELSEAARAGLRSTEPTS